MKDVIKLLKENISVKIVHVPVIKPLDTESIIKESIDTKLVITLENHSIIGGLGSAVCETLSQACPKKVIPIGINDEFGQSGSANDLMKFYGLDAASLVKRIDEGGVKEVILATNPTTEGETTSLYLNKILSNKGVEISRIAYGVPMGANLDYTDEYTLLKSLQGRKPYNK